MAALVDTVELELAQALRGIDTIESALTDATQSFKVGLVDALSVLAGVEVDADAAAVTEAIAAAVEAADTTAVIQADGGAVTTSVTDAVAAADADVPVEADPAALAAVRDDIERAVDEADTSIALTVEGGATPTEGIDAATESVGALGTAATGTSDALGSVGSAATIVNTSATLAAGQMGQLRNSLPTSGVLGGVATGLGAVAAAGSAFASSALEAEQAEQRWNRTLGESAQRVADIDIGGLVTDIDALAVSVGSDDEGLRLAAADLFELGRASNAARPDIEATTEQIVALSARAVALRPSLGEAGDIVGSLTQALARGGRPAAAYGLALTSTDIAARALADSGKRTAAELTVYERAAAGAALVTEQLGAALGADIAAGSETGVIRLRSVRQEFGNFVEDLGAPIAPTFIRVIEEAQDPLQDAVEIGAELAEEVLPLLVDGLDAATPALSAMSDAAGVLADGLGFVVGLVSAIPDPVLEGTAAFLIYSRIIRELALASGFYTRAKVVETAATAAGAVADRAAATARLEYAGAAAVAARVTGGAAPRTAALSAATSGLTAVTGGLTLGLGLVAAGLAVGTTVLATHRKEQEETRRAVDELSAAFADQSTSLDEDIASLVKQRFTDLVREVREVGVSFADLEDFAQRGDEGVFALAQSLEASGNAATGFAAAFRTARENGLTFGEAVNTANAQLPDLDSNSEKVILTLGKMQKAAQVSAETQVLLANSSGKVTDAALAASEANNTAADGTVNYVAVLRELLPEQAATADALGVTAANADAVADSTDAVLERFVALTTEQDTYREGLRRVGPELLGLQRQFNANSLTLDEFNNALARTPGLTGDQLLDFLSAGRDGIDAFNEAAGDDMTRALDEVGPALGGVIAEFARGRLSNEEFLNVIARTPLTIDELNAALQQAGDEVSSYADTVTAKLPTVSDAFADLGEKPLLDAFLKKFQQQAQDSAKFVDNIEALFARGADDLAAALLEEGGATGAALAGQAVRLGAAGLAARETQFDRSAAQLETAQADERRVAIEHGLTMLGIQTTNLSLLANIPAPDLTKPLKQGVEAAAEAFAREDRRLLQQARDAAPSPLDISAKQLAAMRTAGARLANEYIVGLIGALDEEKAGEAFRAGERIAAAVDAGARNRLDARSPSRVAADLGGDWLAGLVLGLSDTTEVERAAAAVAASVVVRPGSPTVGRELPPVTLATSAAAVGGAVGAQADGGLGDLLAETRALRAQQLEEIALLRRVIDATSGVGDATATAIRRGTADPRLAPAALR